MRKTLSTAFFISLIALASCTKLLEEDFPDFNDEYVINNLLIEGDSIKLQLLKTSSINSTENTLVEGAVIELSINGEAVGNLNYLPDSGHYQFNQAVAQNNTYRFKVALPNNDSICIEQNIPKAQPILNFEHIDVAGTSEEGEIHPALKIEVPNKSDEKLYFFINIKLFDYSGGTRMPSIIKIEDPVLLNEAMPFPVFSNEIMKGNSQEILINYITGSAQKSMGESYRTTFFPMIIELWTLNEAYYEFIKQNYQYEYSRYPLIGSGNQTAISNFNNIKGAYGIAAGYSFVTTDTIFPTGTENFFNQ